MSSAKCLSSHRPPLLLIVFVTHWLTDSLWLAYCFGSGHPGTDTGTSERKAKAHLWQTSAAAKHFHFKAGGIIRSICWRCCYSLVSVLSSSASVDVSLSRFLFTPNYPFLLLLLTSQQTVSSQSWGNDGWTPIANFVFIFSPFLLLFLFLFRIVSLAPNAHFC